MPVEIHRSVQEPDDLHGIGACNAVEEDVPRRPARAADRIGKNARPNAGEKMTAPRIASERQEPGFDKVAVVESLDRPPALFRVLENLDDILLRQRRADHTCHPAGELRSKADDRGDLRHQLCGGTLNTEAGVEFRDARIESFAQHRALLLFKRVAHDFRDARVLTDAHALFREGLEVFGEPDCVGGSGHDSAKM